MANAEYYIERKTNKHQLYGWLGTILLHSGIIVLLIFFVLYPPNPPLEMEGMTMSLGEENMGGPNQELVSDPQPNEQYTEITEEVVEIPPVTQDIEESVAINTKVDPKKPKKEVVPIVEPKEEKPRLELPTKVDAKALFTKSNKNSGEGGRGAGEIPGNEGRPDGDPNGDPNGRGQGNSGYGTGSDGISFDLAGRKVKKLPEIEDNSRETGKIVVSIVVNRNGEVIKAIPGQKGTNNLSPALLEKAKQGALQTKFSAREDGPDEQYGTMTIVFRFKE